MVEIDFLDTIHRTYELLEHKKHSDKKIEQRSIDRKKK